ncbi:MAG: metallophosphoesterase, partial [Elusimicrobia bacterium]|nr:metallophosphoesterase [Elusimicrobiota bacterium]
MKIVIAAAVLLLSACGSVPTSRTAAGFPACDPSRPVQTVTLVHVTDLHEHYGLAADGVSPYARIRGYFDSIRNENRDSLFMDGGDDQEKGSIAGQLSNGVASRDMIRAMGFDARVMGNHDFAWGEAGALDHSHDPHAVVLATNIRYVGKDPVGFGATDYAEIHVGCVTLGLVGPVTTPWNAEDEPFAGQYPGFRGNYDYAAAVRAALKKRRDADAIIVLSHLGREDDLKLAAAVPSVDLVLGGHTHGVTWEPISAGRAKYVESGHDAEYVTRVDLDFDPRTRRLIGLRHDLTRVGPDMPVDSAVQ